jgi:beta-glucosidase
MHFLSALILSLPIWAAASAAAQNPDRSGAIIARMTLEEKVGQLVMVGFDEIAASDVIERGAAGSLISFNDPAAIAEVQAKARASRLGIPLLVGLDLLHGYRTLFPMPLGEAASFDPALAARNAELSAREAVPAGINWTFAPMVDVSRDPRWGRAVEGSGEDVLLASDFAAARAAGFRAGGLVPTLKHFAGYGATDGGRDYDSISVSDLPPFRAALAGGLSTVMPALTVLNGIPASADRAHIQDILRGAWGFRGVVVSDWGGIEGLVAQGVAADGPDAVRQAMTAGIDIDMASGYYTKYLADEVRAGRVGTSDLDAAVRRVLELKFQLGLFDAPPIDSALSETAALTPALREAARDTVRRTSVLLRNENAFLPLKPDVKTIAVVGPFADDGFEQLGPHEARGRAEEAVTLLKGISERARKNGTEVRYAQGCDSLCYEDTGFSKAVDAARASDVVIAVLGERREYSGEGASRAFLDFWGRQEDLLEALAATGKPIILVIVAGRPLDLRRASKIAPAILMAWYPGTEGGNGIADILFGDFQPTAKLPLSWPRSVGQSPLSYGPLATGRPFKQNSRYTLRFIDEEGAPLYPFGHGLSYTSFEYSDLAVTPIQTPAWVDVSVKLTNTGLRTGTEIMQLYVRDEVASRVRPVRELKKYRRVTLRAGEARSVTFRIKREDLGFYDETGKFLIENGRFSVGVGGDATTPLEASFTLAD